jgi:hypothetical protein
MNNKTHRIFLIFFLFFLSTSFFFPAIAKAQYGVKHRSQYVWAVKEEIQEQIIEYELTAEFNMNQNSVNATKFFYSNGSSIFFNMQMNQFVKYIKAFNEISGKHNHFYTGPGTLKFPRHVVIEETNDSTQVTDYETGIILYYTSDALEHELIKGSIPISWTVWIILALTIGLCGFSIVFLYKRGRRHSQVLVYKIA